MAKKLPLTIEITEVAPTQTQFDIPAFTKKLCTLLNIQTGSIEITFLNNADLKKMNQAHLNHNYNTDIITFNLGSPKSPMGDIYISIDQAKKQAQELQHSLEFEIKTLIAHGLLHVLGYEDDTEEKKAIMFKKQDELLAHP